MSKSSPLFKDQLDNFYIYENCWMAMKQLCATPHFYKSICEEKH